MTTITSNGYYLIADNCVTIERTSNLKNKTPGVKTKKVSLMHSNENKIIIPEKTITIEKNKVMAWAGSGNVEKIFNFMSNINNLDILDYVDIYSNIVTINSLNEGFSIFLITENFYTYVVKVCLKPIKNTYNVNCEVDCYLPGTLVLGGSGSGIIENLLDCNLIDFEDLKKEHPLLTHLFMCNSCNYSSFSYDVYGAKEKQIFFHIKPDYEAIDQAIKFFNSIKRDFYYNSK